MHIIKKFIKTDYFIFILFFFSFSYYFDTLNNFVNDANKYIPYWLTINDEFRFGDIPVKFESDLFLDYAIGLIVALSIYFSISLINISKEKKTLLKKIWFTQILVIYIFSFILYYYKGLDPYGYFFYLIIILIILLILETYLINLSLEMALITLFIYQESLMRFFSPHIIC